MGLIWKILFGLNALISLISGISIWVTGESSSLVAQVVDNFLLFFFFGVLTFATVNKEGSK